MEKMCGVQVSATLYSPPNCYGTGLWGSERSGQGRGALCHILVGEVAGRAAVGTRPETCCCFLFFNLFSKVLVDTLKIGVLMRSLPGSWVWFTWGEWVGGSFKAGRGTVPLPGGTCGGVAPAEGLLPAAEAD